MLTFQGASPDDARNKRILGDKLPERDRVGMWHIRYYTHQCSCWYATLKARQGWQMAGLGATPVALITNPRDQPGPLPNVLGRGRTGHATEYVAGMSEVV